MSKQMQKEFEKLFDEFAAKYDQHSDAWQDMPLDEVFIAGCIASRQSLVVELKRLELEESQDSYTAGIRHGFNMGIDFAEVALDKAGVPYK
jgi:hypothetical protein